jgi:hypothetical protein
VNGYHYWQSNCRWRPFFCNRDYEPAAIARDAAVAGQIAGKQAIDFLQYKDQVIFETGTKC